MLPHTDRYIHRSVNSMADKNQPEKITNIIQPTVNVNKQETGSEANAVKIEQVAGDVHFHRETTPPPSFRSEALIGVLAFLGAIFINIATSQLPPGLQPYLWLSWPLALLVTGASIWFASRQERSREGVLALAQRNRRWMLDKVEDHWIKGVLEQSLFQKAEVELGLEKSPGMVTSAYETIHSRDTTRQAVPAGKQPIELFDNSERLLLILGAPGAGKTTLLLELARSLIERARSDGEHPIPVVFNLSTWTGTSWVGKSPGLRGWLADQLNELYGVSKELAQDWVDSNTILPLLDGLDEVAADRRDACVEAINTYRHERGLVRLAVCCRREDYEKLKSKLRLEGAISIQQLSKEQVEAYIHQFGQPAVGLQMVLSDDPMLWELLNNPLMLGIAALAYKDATKGSVQPVKTLEERRELLFNHYIGAMFRRQERSPGFSRLTHKQTIRWLSWLAAQMKQHQQTELLIERMQPNWLNIPQRHSYQWCVSLLNWLVIGLFFGLAFGVVVWLAVGLFFGLAVGVAVGLLVGFGIGLVVGFRDRAKTEPNKIELVASLRWSWLRGWYGLRNGWRRGWRGKWNYNLRIRPLVWIAVGLYATMIIGLIAGLHDGLRGGLQHGDKLQRTIIPNEGIWRSLRSWLVVGVLFGLVGVLVVGLFGLLVVGSVVGLVYALVGVLVVGLLIGLVFGLDYGGRAVIQHCALRLLLRYNKLLPLIKLVPFLDYCVDRIFLYKVGGGYIFVHRLLMNHFSNLYTEPD